jgi:hypothetical protein
VDGFYATAYQGINVYAGLDVAGPPNGYYVEWRGDPGVSLYASVNDCSSFSDVLMTRAYGWIPPTTNPRPLAEDYYWAIRSGTGFTEITNVNDVDTGDVIALRYPASDADTGHVAWIDAPPSAFAGPPEEPGLSGYAVTVVDSSNDFHDGANGPSTAADNRYLGLLSDGSQCATDLQCLDLYGQNATCNSTELSEFVDGGTVPFSVCAYSGVGRGQMRLFADSTGTIQGYSWSPDAYSSFYPRPNPLPAQGASFPSNDIVVGRYVGQ